MAISTGSSPRAPALAERPPLPRRRALAALGAGACLALAAFALPAAAERAEPEAPPAPPLPTLRLAVAEIEIVSAYAPGTDAVDKSVPFSPKTALETWAQTHVRAVGRQWTAQIVIRDASITAREVEPRTGNWRDWFRRQPVERYDAVLELELLIRDDAGRVRARTRARAAHARFLMDDHGDYDRERLLQLQQLTDEVLAAALNRLDAELRHNLGEWVR